MGVSFFLMIILFLGFLAQARVVVLASIILLLFKELEIKSLVVFFSERGIEIGLVFLLIAIFSSIVVNPVDSEQLKSIFISRRGIIAVLGGLMATKFNGMGLSLLKDTPQITAGIIFGSLIGIIFFDGIPVGPLTAAGLTAIFLQLLGFFA